MHWAFLRSAIKNYQEFMPRVMFKKPCQKIFFCKLEQAVFCGVWSNCEEDIYMTQVIVY